MNENKFDLWLLGKDDAWLSGLTMAELLAAAERVDNLREYIDEKYADIMYETGERTRVEICNMQTGRR